MDQERQRASVTYCDVTRTAQFVGDQGSVILPKGSDNIFFTPVTVKSVLPPADQQEWPMGDAPMASPPPLEVSPESVEIAIDHAFADPSDLTVAVVIVHKGAIVGERYSPGITKDTQLESWSMGKSMLSTLFAVLVEDGTFRLDDLAPVPEWQNPGDKRGQIKIRDLLQMSSGLRFTSALDPGTKRLRRYPDHGFAYCEAIDAYAFARSKRLELPTPKPKGRYRNCDPWVLGSLIKDVVLSRGEEFLSFPQRALFDKIGIRKQVIEPDTYGNLLFSGCDYGTARNWARLGLLYLQNGVWNNQRLLPEGWTDFVSTPAPAWEKREYGGMFWLNLEGAYPMLPPDTYFAAGAGGLYTFIVPKHDLVVVRLGHANDITGTVPRKIESVPTKGSAASTGRMLEKLIEAMPPT